jgi:hypothetical protein
MSADEYHADPVPGGSLSSSGARKLLPPNCPALFHHERQHGRPPKRELDLGHAAHKLVLGVGPDLVVVDASDWRTKAAQDKRDEARATGAVPLLRAEWEQLKAMAEALRAHPVASALFAPGRGKPEQALIWQDGPTGVWRRALLDWLPAQVAGWRLIVPDYKTTRDADPESIARAVHTYGYHQQAAWYLDGVKALGLHGQEPAFVFVFQEKTAPYLVTVVELDALALRIGAARNRRALETYARCTAEDRWPGYSDAVESICLPAWAEKSDSEEYL